MPEPTNFESMPDAEINRWAAERDGWVLEPAGAGISAIRPNGEVSFMTVDGDARVNALLLEKTRFPTSADAGLALGARWGMRLDELSRNIDGGYTASCQASNGRGYTQVGQNIERAAMNALCAAKEAEERADG